MEPNYNFEEIWKQKDITTPDSTSVIKKANIYRKKQLLSSLILTLSLFATAGIIIWVWVQIPDLHFSTKTGIILILTGILFFIFQVFQNMKIINKINPSLNNQDYLKQLKILQHKQLYLQTKAFSIYFFLLSFGMAFYLFGLVQKRNLFWGIFIYSVTFAWFLFIWFYIKPRRTKKQQLKIQEVIHSLEALEKDIES